MNGLQKRCIGFSKQLQELAIGYPKPSREQRRLLRGAMRVQGYTELLGGEVTPTSTRLFQVASDEYLKTLAGVGLDPERVGKPSGSPARNQNKRARPVMQGFVVLFFPRTNNSPSTGKKQVGSQTSCGNDDQKKSAS
ncbi:MAG: hypothetical protein HY000_25195 [Planctomycetes bacterium]|nr:hypothetical protein [Planctomycetota bacterium]